MKAKILLLAGLMTCLTAQAQMGRFPAFAGGVPGMAQMQAIFLQRHQARTALYREALDILRKNPQAADVPECSSGETVTGQLCLKTTTVPAASTPASATAVAASVKEIPPPVRLPVASPVAAPVEKSPPPVAEASRPQPAPLPPRRIAILVGNNSYSKPIPPLETPVADVEAMAKLLQSRFGFEAKVIRNAAKAQIIEAINEVAATARPEDSILLLYAGHGYLMDDTRMGFWIPVDASVKTPANWISNADISKMLKAIPARQLILVSDSCFSGSLTKEQKFSALSKAEKEDILRRRSVLVFSSGDEEPVSDEGKEGHSIFAYNLIKALESVNGFTPGYEIYKVVHGKVTKEYEQTPQYGAVLTAGHVGGGEYIFEPQLR